MTVSKVAQPSYSNASATWCLLVAIITGMVEELRASERSANARVQGALDEAREAGESCSVMEQRLRESELVREQSVCALTTYVCRL